MCSFQFAHLLLHLACCWKATDDQDPTGTASLGKPILLFRHNVNVSVRLSVLLPNRVAVFVRVLVAFPDARSFNLNQSRVKTNDLPNLYLSPHSLVFGINRLMARTCLVCIRIMGLSGILGHGAIGPVLQLGRTVKSLSMWTVTCKYLSLCDYNYVLRCCQDVKLQQTNKCVCEWI